MPARACARVASRPSSRDADRAQLGPTRRRPGSPRSSRATSWPSPAGRSRPTATPGTRSAARSRPGVRRSRSGAATGWPAGPARWPCWSDGRRPTRPSSTPGSPGCRSGPAVRPRSGRRPRPGRRAFSPNGDGSEDGLAIRWTNGVALDSLTLRVFGANGSIVGTRPVPDVGPGAHAWTWDGAVDGHRLADGRYMLQLVGKSGSRTFTAPSVKPMLAAQVALYAVAIDTVGPRLTGATAAGAWSRRPATAGTTGSPSGRPRRAPPAGD